ncbi:MerR family DNA-binding transcriptional regulator [Kitasatospora sp. NPDC058965]|uniref:helix-turn-helix domain-containing protein n=1 Tax=Kitasatospora sp. NPDC058965 TaxID=3346682 RepID=UPI0036AF7623
MSGGTPPGGETSLTIGVLAELAGVSVKTVRFYSDQGLLPEAARSAGGHRRYGGPALARLRELRGLRALGLSLAGAAEVARGELPLAEALAGQRRELARQLAELRWREAALTALAGAPDQLLVLGEALREQPSQDAFAAFWHRILPLRLPARLKGAIVDAAVPELPTDPTPAQALAYARLRGLALDRGYAAAVRGPQPDDCPGLEQVYRDTGEAYELALAQLDRPAPGAPTEALGAFVAAYARAERRTDSAGYRRELAGRPSAHDLLARYWSLAGQLHPRPTMGAAHDWISAALRAEVGAP